jgi:hypothetical protein
MDTSSLKLLDVVEMKKEHPCEKRSHFFKVVRLGADIKISCLACGRTVMLDRAVFNQKIKRILPKP